MYLKSLYLYNFRLYQEAVFDFCPHLNMICGPNAAGKTSLIEAICFLAAGHSFRSHQTAHLIRNGSSYFYLEAIFVKHGIEQRLKITHSHKERKIFINNTSYSTTSSLVGLLLTVVFSPADIDLIKGGPQGRRQYLDEQLAQADPLYHYHCNRYARAMRQRNCLLKAKNFNSIHSWEYEMAVSAAYLVQKRLELLEELQKHAKLFYEQIAEADEALSLAYRSASGKISNDQSALRIHFLEQYEKNREREVFFASTLVGPHKDELTVSIGENEARYFASEGQMRSCAAALRLAEWKRLETFTGEKPLMLLDDISTSLDQKRTEHLFRLLDSLGQLFLTGTEEPICYPDNIERKMISLPNSIL